MNHTSPNIVIIGMGFLATYIIPCYADLIGDDMEAHVIGIKGSSRGLAEKQAECPFPVVVGHVYETLLERRPDIIVLAVKPEQIAAMTEQTLKPYYQFLRTQGQPLPDLYSFAPDPAVTYFYQALGPDVNAVNMIPNMIRRICGIDVAQIGVAFVAFDRRRQWPAENRSRALSFLKPTGTVVEIASDKAIPFLSMQVACHLMFELNYIVQDVLEELGQTMTLAQSASAFRTVIHQFFQEECTRVLPCSTLGIDPNLLDFMDQLLHSWHDGVMDFAREEDIPAGAADRLICGTMEAHQLEAQLEPREQLVQNTKNHATPGGFLEMGLTTFHKIGYGQIADALRSRMQGQPVPGLYDAVRTIAHDVAKAVSDHGKTVSGIAQ